MLRLKYLPNQLKYGLTDNEVVFSVIPGVKHERAKVLAQHFDSLDKIINTDIDYLSNIKVNLSFLINMYYLGVLIVIGILLFLKLMSLEKLHVKNVKKISF
jgi:hypothetical protein